MIRTTTQWRRIGSKLKVGAGGEGGARLINNLDKLKQILKNYNFAKQVGVPPPPSQTPRFLRLCNIMLLSWICYRLFTMSDVARPARGSAIRQTLCTPESPYKRHTAREVRRHNLCKVMCGYHFNTFKEYTLYYFFFDCCFYYFLLFKQYSQSTKCSLCIKKSVQPESLKRSKKGRISAIQ